MTTQKENRLYKPFNGVIGLLAALIILGLSIAFGFAAFSNESIAMVIPTVILAILGFCIWGGVNTIDPKLSVVITSFGYKIGYCDIEGFHWFPFWYNLEKVELADSNYESETIKVNDKNGTPIVSSLVYTVRVVEPERYFHNLDQGAKAFTRSRIQGILRDAIDKYPYDTCQETNPDMKTLTKNGKEICKELQDTFNQNLAKYGLEIDDASFSRLNYAPEISAAMLQKQQAQANIDAKTTLTKGLCDVVKNVVNTMSEENEMDKKDKQKLSAQLMLIMLGNQEPTPVINIDN